MKPIIFNANYLLDESNMDFTQPVEIHVTRFFNNNNPQHRIKDDLNKLFLDNHYESKNAFKVFLDSNEPKVCYMKEKIETILKYGNYYNLILTSTEEILNNLPNAKKFLYGTTWLNKNNKNNKIYLGEVQEDFKGFDFQKENSISFLKTNKTLQMMHNVPGYIFREKIWPLKSKINHTTLFYYSNIFKNLTNIENDGVLPNDDKLNIFKSKFSIIIENSQETNYFSEKLIDCLLTKTIPIYWGCPNITEYFDKDGFIFIENENDFLIKINSINFEKYYLDKINAIEKNFEEAKKYALNFSKRVETEIKKFI
jgi:hypothetical protein